MPSVLSPETDVGWLVERAIRTGGRISDGFSPSSVVIYINSLLLCITFIRESMMSCFHMISCYMYGIG